MFPIFKKVTCSEIDPLNRINRLSPAIEISLNDKDCVGIRQFVKLLSFNFRSPIVGISGLGLPATIRARSENRIQAFLNRQKTQFLETPGVDIPRHDPGKSLLGTLLAAGEEGIPEEKLCFVHGLIFP